ncbi:MAG TPA: BT4734/BF3469 family protein [Bacteroidia bacterium]|nr:BT4734/BF3469 family protein [Bacteroidia bacterium]
MTVTIFKTFYDTQPYYQPVEAILGRIKSGKSLTQVNVCRGVYNDPNEYAKQKKKLPCILFSGRFTERAIKGLTEHSGFICLDFDKFPNEDELALWRDNLECDEYTYSIFTSPSGMGLKCLVKIPIWHNEGHTTDQIDHKSYFRGLQNYYQCQYFDPNVFDVSRICFESYDPELQINSCSSVWTGQVFDPTPVQVEYGKASLDEQETVRRLMKWFDRKYGMNNGNRNNNLFKLCAAFNDYGVDIDYALSIVSAFQMEDFRLGEIETTLRSAYKKTGKHGTLSF